MKRKTIIEKIKKETPQDVKKFTSAIKLFNQIYGISFTADQITLDEIKSVLDFEPSIEAGKILKASILKKATSKANKGMDNNGTFFIQ